MTLSTEQLTKVAGMRDAARREFGLDAERAFWFNLLGQRHMRLKKFRDANQLFLVERAQALVEEAEEALRQIDEEEHEIERGL